MSQQDVAEQLSLWVDAVDAIHVSRALHAVESLPAEVVPLAQAGGADTMDAVLQAAKADVIALITGHGAPLKPMRARVERTPSDSPDSWKRDDFAAQVQR